MDDRNKNIISLNKYSLLFSHQWKVALDAKDPYGSGLRLVTFASSTPTYRGFPSDLEK